MSEQRHEQHGGGQPPVEQHRADGSLRHLITLEGLRREEIEALLERAQHYVRVPGRRPLRSRALAGVQIANLFTEPSTRTRVSFELAGRRLGAEVVNLEVQLSSRVKGESMLDTIYTLQALHFDVFVIRDAEPGVLAHVSAHVGPTVSVLSAGEAHLSHPTQGLLDALTVRQHKGPIEALSIAIVGDIRHSRVARSAYHVFRLLQARELRIVAPPALMPGPDELPGCARFETLEDGLADVDVVMMLRIQKERFAEAALPDGGEYFERYGLTPARLARTRADAIVMHPQPMNRGIEIASEIADGPQSVIRAQVSNGVAVRMAVLEAIAGRLAA
ncbi:MAG TPA: aspartate carbamoyltransferase catalytic subunit [Steroidobacteraceae bacterium]|jgi:aspartate carbamoyltransferase catalytic subunit|nr:aspartate carbamoyltransferase catalytic subunit [Steroidobacteraceae bacterium]